MPSPPSTLQMPGRVCVPSMRTADRADGSSPRRDRIVGATWVVSTEADSTLSLDTGAVYDHQHMAVTGVHAAVLGDFGRPRVDDAFLDLAEDVRVAAVVDGDTKEVGGGRAGPDLGETRVLDGDGVRA